MTFSWTKKSPIRTTTFIPLLLFILSLLLRLSLISKGPYDLDGLTMALHSLTTVATGKLSLLHSHGFPLSALLGAGSVAIAAIFGIDDPIQAVNLLAVVASALCVPLFYIFVDRTLGSVAAFFSASLLSVSPIFLGNSVFGNTHPLGLLFILLGSINILSYRRRPSWQNAVLSGLVLGLAGASRVQDLAVVLPALTLLFWRGASGNQTQTTPPKTSLKNLCLFLATTVAVVALFYGLTFSSNRFSSPEKLNNFFDFELASRFVGPSFDYLPYCYLFLRANFSYIGLVVTTAGLLWIRRTNKNLALITLAWVLGPAVAFGMLDIINPRFFFVALPPLYLAIGFVISRIFLYRPFTRYLAVGLWLGLLSLSYARIYPAVSFRHQNELLPDFYRWLGRRVEPNAQVIIADGGPFLSYYAHRTQLRRPLKVRQPYTPGELKNFQDTLDGFLQKSIPIYITGTGLYSHNPDEQFSRFMENHYRLSLVGWKATEEWHRGAIYLKTFYEMIYRVQQPREGQPAGIILPTKEAVSRNSPYRKPLND